MYLDTPVKLKGDHYVVEQKCISTDVEITREHLQETWSSMRNGTATPIPEGYWDEAAEVVTSIKISLLVLSNLLLSKVELTAMALSMIVWVGQMVG